MRSSNASRNAGLKLCGKGREGVNPSPEFREDYLPLNHLSPKGWWDLVDSRFVVITPVAAKSCSMKYFGHGVHIVETCLGHDLDGHRAPSKHSSLYPPSFNKGFAKAHALYIAIYI